MDIKLIMCTASCLIPGLASAITVSIQDNATQLANNIIGSGVALVGTPTLTGAFGQAGTYTNAVSIGGGTVFSTGNVSDIPGTPSNTLNTDFGGTGDTDVSNLTFNGSAIGATYDAVFLEFDFISEYNNAHIQYFFATDDGSTIIDDSAGGVILGGPYTDEGIANSSYNDAALILVDGFNIGLLPNNNDLTTLGLFDLYAPYSNPYGLSDISDTGFGEHSALLGNVGPFGPNQIHHIKIAVADGGDGVFDTALFIPNGSLTSVSAVPIPAAIWLFGSGLLGLIGVARRKKSAV